MSVPLSLLMEDESKPVFTLDWRQEQIPEESTVTGSVVEFAFGPVENSYLATSYPYRAEHADVSDTRKVAKQNIPLPVLKKIALLQPRYIMNLAFRPNTTDWFIFCYRSRTAYDAKWEPRKPSRKDSVGGYLDEWRIEANDQVSSCAFGESSHTWFLRATDSLTKWYPELGPGVTPKLRTAFRNAYERKERKKKGNDKEVLLTKLRAVTFGHGGTWILYSKDIFQWSEHGLPETLVRALELGQRENWIINKVVLNPSNPNEYVLVYDHGPVYCSFHTDFQAPFKEILLQWSASMRKWRKDYKTHDSVSSYKWEDPSEAVFSPDNDVASDGDDYDNSTAMDTAKASPQSNFRLSQSRDGEAEATPVRSRHYSSQSQKTNWSDQLIHDDTSRGNRSDQLIQGDTAQGGKGSREGGSSEGLVHDPGTYIGGMVHTRPEIELMNQMQQMQEKLHQLQQQYHSMYYNQNATMGINTRIPPHLQAPFQGSQPQGPMGYQTIQLPLTMLPELTQQKMYMQQQPQYQGQFQNPHNLDRASSQALPERDEEQELRLRRGQWRSPRNLVQEEVNPPPSQPSTEKSSRTEASKKSWLSKMAEKKQKQPPSSSGRR